MKKILIGLGVLLVLLVVAVLVGPSFYDWNQHKQLITEEARKATGRDLVIDGDISAAILPMPTISVAGIRFANAEGGSAPDMVTLETLKVRVALFPLIQGNVQIEEITLVKPVILLEKLPNGKGNWEITPAAAEPATTTPEQGGGGMPAVSLDNVNITDGTLIYRDAVAKSEQKIEALNANLAAASLQGPFGAKGSLNYQGLPATFDVSTGKIDPAQPAPVAIALGLGGAGSQGDAQIKFTGTLAQAADGVSAVGKLEGGSANLAAALEALAPGSGSGAPIALDKPFKIAGDVNYAPAGGKIEKFTLALGDLTAAGDVSFTPGSPSQAAVKLAINRIDLDALLAQAAAKPAAPAAETAPQDAGAFALPTGINAAVDIAIDAISYRGGLIDNTKFVGELANGEFAIKQFSAQLPGGAAVSAAGALTAVDGKPQIGGALEAKADNLRALLDWLQVAPAGVPAERLRSLALTSRFTAAADLLELADLDLKLDSSHVTGGLRIALPRGGQQKMAFGVGLAIDQLNVDDYMPPAAAPADAAPKPAGGGGLPLDSLKPLADLDANVEMRVGKLTVNQQTLQGVHLDGTVTGGTLTLRDLSVKEFAGGKVALNGTVTDLAGNPRFDTKFDLTAKDANKAFQAAGMGDRVKGKLGALKLAGALAGGAQDVNFDIDFGLSGIGASGQAKGKASGIGQGVVPRIDSTFNVQAKDAGPLLALAGIKGDVSKLGALSLKGNAASGADDLTYDVAISIAGAGAKGTFKGRVLALSSAAPKVDTKLDFSADKPAPLLALAGMAGPEANKLGKIAATGSMAGNANDMKLDLALQGFGGAATVAGTVQTAAAPAPTRFDLAVTANHPEFRQLLSALVPGYQPAAAKLGPLQFSAKAQGSTDKANISGLSLRAGQTSLTGQASMDKSSGKPFYSAALRGGTVDVSPFMPPPAKGGSGGGERWSREKLDLSALQSMDADVDFSADHFVANTTVIDNLKALLTLRDGTLTIKQLNGNTYGGVIDLTGALASRGVPTFNGHVTGSNVAVSQLMGGGFLANRITGPVSFDTDLTSSGYSMADLVGGLQGNGKVDGSITVLSQVEQQVGSALLGILGQQVKQLQGFTESVNAVYSAFTGSPNALNGTFDINQGVLNTQDLSLTNNRARLLATGDANIAAWTMDMIANIFSQEYPDQPYLSIDLDGPMDGPNTKFSGNAFARGSDQSQGVFGNQSPTDIFNGIIPGLPGSEGSGEGGGVGIPGLGGVIPGIGGGDAGAQGGGETPGIGGIGTESLPDVPGADQQNEALPEGAAPDVAAPGEQAPGEAPAGEQPGEAVAPETEPAPADQPSAEPDAATPEGEQPSAEPEGEENAPVPPEKPDTPSDFGQQPAAEPEVAPEPAPEPVPEAQPEPEPQPEPAPQPEPEAEPEIAPEPAPEPEPQVAPQPAPEPEPEVAPQPEAAPEPAPEPAPEVAPEPVPDSAPVLVPQPEESQTEQPKKRTATDAQTQEQPAEQAVPEAQPEGEQSTDPGTIVPLIEPEPQ
ncbi:MAG TPA: AsmA family protein [Verrucomicrobiae bacterium]|nr:AsmA family protein [Verrucomicrobiae bacterium]